MGSQVEFLARVVDTGDGLQRRRHHRAGLGQGEGRERQFPSVEEDADDRRAIILVLDG